MSIVIPRAEEQYLAHLKNIHENGFDQHNERTGKFTRALVSLDMTYDATTNKAPIVTTRQIKNPHAAIAEFIGYLRGYTNAEQFVQLGAKTWLNNANGTPAWLANPHREGENDCGLIYGAVARHWPIQPSAHTPIDAGGINLIRKVYENLKKGVDDRGEIITFWNPGMFHLGCLRPCMYEHQFSLLGDDLYLNSTQRSNDWPIGCTANMVQVWIFLRLMAQITGKNPKYAYHRSVNCHIYDNQLEFVPEQLSRTPFEEPTIDINPDIKTLEDLETWVTMKDFVINYPDYHAPIPYPFAV